MAGKVMDNVPDDYLKACPATDLSAVVAWWQQLPDAERGELAKLFDTRGDSCSFALDAQEGVGWHAVPVVVDSRLLPTDAEPDIDWDGEYFEYRMCHTDWFPLELYCHRTFYIGSWTVVPFASENSYQLAASAAFPADR